MRRFPFFSVRSSRVRAGNGVPLQRKWTIEFGWERPRPSHDDVEVEQ